jgi:hypothetical protein
LGLATAGEISPLTEGLGPAQYQRSKDLAAELGRGRRRREGLWPML